MVKGCYASISQGCAIVTGVLNGISGAALVGIGIYLSIYTYSTMAGYKILGYACFLAGMAILVVGVLGIIGSCFETVTYLKVAFIMIIIMVMSLMGLVIWAFVSSGSAAEHARSAWFAADNDVRSNLESQMHCCGYDSIAEGTPNCTSKKACGKIFGEKVAGLPSLAGFAAAFALVVLTISTCGTGCLWHKLNDQQRERPDKSMTLRDQRQEIERGKFRFHQPRTIFTKSREAREEREAAEDAEAMEQGKSKKDKVKKKKLKK